MRITSYWLLLALVCLAGQAASAARIEFLPEAVVQQETMQLGDIARISPQAVAEKWQGLKLFKVPDYGTVRSYRASTLRAYILQKTQDEAPISWAGAEKVQVRRAGDLVSKEDMLRLVNDFIRQRLKRTGISGLRFEPGHLPREFTLPNDDWDCEIIAADKDLLAARRFSLLFRRQGSLIKNVTVRGRVRAQAEVVVARSDLKRDAVIGPKDIALEQRSVSRLEDPVYDPQAAIGQRVRHGVSADQVLKRGLLSQPILIERGQPVTLQVVQGALVITASGIAQEDGGLKETIRVENSRSGREVFGRVLDSETIEVRF